jgi:hypothetical protein
MSELLTTLRTALVAGAIVLLGQYYFNSVKYTAEAKLIGEHNQRVWLEQMEARMFKQKPPLWR